MVDFTAAVKKPFQDTNTLIIGVVLGFIPLVNTLTILGFSIKNAQQTLAGKNKLLKWEDFGDILIKSITGIAIGIVYSLPILLLGLFLIGSLFVTFASMAPALSQTNDLSQVLPVIAPVLMGAIGSIMILIVLMALTSFITPMAVMNWAKKGNIGAAFAFKEVFHKAFNGTYLIAWLLSFAYQFVLAIGFLFAMFIPIIGFIIGAGLISYLGSVTSYELYAQAYKEIK